MTSDTIEKAVQQTVQRTVRKSEMEAQNHFDYGKLVFPRNEFIDCSFQEGKEEVIFTYDTKGYRPFEELKKEQRDTILINLIDCAKFVEIAQSYRINLKPENLLYNIHNQVFVLDRDVYGKGEEFSKQDFLKQYKALIGFALQKKYSYKDYFDGGLELLKKDKFLSQIVNLEEIEEITECLTTEYEALVQMYRATKILADKGKTKRNKILLAVSSCLLVMSLVFIGIQVFYMRPYERAVMEGNRSYLKLDYSSVIDSFQKVKLDRLSVYDKYILAYSYIQCESLTGEQKENIMNALSLETNEKVLDYWIYLGKLDVEKAEDIAQQISDDDLLLYAYLKDKSIVEEDTSMSGSDKEQHLEDLNSKIEKLSETYTSSDEDEESSTDTEASSETEASEDSNENTNAPESTDGLDDIDVVE